VADLASQPRGLESFAGAPESQPVIAKQPRSVIGWCSGVNSGSAQARRDPRAGTRSCPQQRDPTNRVSPGPLADGTWLLSGFGCHGGSDPDPTNLETAQEAIEFYFPEGRVIASDAHDWNRDPWFDGTYRIEAFGRAHAFPRIMNVPEGRVFFAGSDMAPSVFRSFWMEGAIVSGHLAAKGSRVPQGSRRALAQRSLRHLRRGYDRLPAVAPSPAWSTLSRPVRVGQLVVGGPSDRD
jgi:hypothetical protein